MTMLEMRLGRRHPSYALCLPALTLLAGCHGATAASTPPQSAPGTPARLVQQRNTGAAPQVTHEQAIASALKVVPGVATSVDLERAGGRIVYVVEVQTRDGGETDVVVDVETGAVLGTD